MGKRRPATPLSSSLHQTLYGAPVDAELDLHGLGAAPALQRVDGFLTEWAHRKPGAVLRIITGKGNRSIDGPVLLDAVRDLLRSQPNTRIKDMIGDSGGGGWVVRLGNE